MEDGELVRVKHEGQAFTVREAYAVWRADGSAELVRLERLFADPASMRQVLSRLAVDRPEEADELRAANEVLGIRFIDPSDRTRGRG